MGLSDDEYRGQIKTMQSHINVGSGQDVSIAELAAIISHVVGYERQITFDRSRPDRSPRKLINVDLLKSFGWKQDIDLVDGLRQTYCWFLENQHSVRAA